MPMSMQDYQRIVVKYKSPFLTIDPEVAADIGQLLDLVLQQASATTKQAAIIKQRDLELHGAKTTMLALTRAIGTIEVPHAAVESLHPDDHLRVSDVETPHGLMKRFWFEAHDAPIVCPSCDGDRGNAGGATCQTCRGAGVIARPPEPPEAPPAPPRAFPRLVLP